MTGPCMCGAEDCERCFPGLRYARREAEADADVEPDDDYPDPDAADRAAGRWEDERTRQAERRGEA